MNTEWLRGILQATIDNAYYGVATAAQCCDEGHSTHFANRIDPTSSQTQAQAHSAKREVHHTWVAKDARCCAMIADDVSQELVGETSPIWKRMVWWRVAMVGKAYATTLPLRPSGATKSVS